MSNTLQDLLPDAPMEKMALVAAADDRLAERLASLFAQGLPPDTALRIASESLAAHTALTPQSCEWVSREIAAALGYLPQRGTPSAWAPADPGRGAPAAPGAGFGGPAGPGPGFGAPRPVGATDITVVPPSQQPQAPFGQPQQPQAPFGQAQQPQAPFGQPPQQPGVPFGAGPQQPGGFGMPPQPPAPYGPPPGNLKPPGSRRSAKVWAAAATAAVAIVAVVLVFVLRSGPTPTPKSNPKLAKPTVSTYHVSSGPLSIALEGTHAWISQTAPDRLLELNASDGTQVRVQSDGLDFPWHITAGGGNVWIANDRKNPGFVTRVNATTGGITRISGTFNGIANPTAVAVQGSRVWVANLGAESKTGFTGYGSVTELDASSGTVVKSFPGAKSGITYPVALAVSGPFVWVVDSGYHGGLGGVTRIDSRDGSTLTKTGGGYGFERPSSIAVSGSRVWVLNDPYRGRLSVTEINASDASFVRLLSGLQYEFGSYVKYLQYRAEGIAAVGDRVWVADPAGGGDGHGAVTEIDARTGGLIRVLSGAPYNFYTPDAIVANSSQVWVSEFGPKNAPGWITVLRSFR